MIGKVNKLGTGFKGHALYLEHGRQDALQADRVDWIESRNLPTRDPQAAARIMSATARDGDSVQPPVYSFSISFDPHDPVNRETMRQVADRTLRDLGLEGHQALIVGHRDRAHPHVHVMVNRVHPEHHKVWSNWHDFRRIERSLREQEAELGLRRVPGRHAALPERDRAGLDRAPARRLERGDGDFVERVRRDAGPHLTGARSWAELERGLAEHGLSVRVEGRGLVVTDGARKVKGSDIDRAASRANLERRLGALGEYRARQAVAESTLDDERAARVKRPLHSDRNPAAQSAAVERPAGLPQLHARTPAPANRAPARVPAAKLDHRRIAESYRGAMDRLYTDPADAREKFRDALLRDGREAAAKTLREQPEAFGRVRPAAVPVSERARDAAGEAFRWSGRLEASGRADALRVGATLRQHGAIKAYDDAAAALEGAEAHLKHARFQRDYVREHIRHLPDAAGKVYQNPRQALWEIARDVHRKGYARTADAIQNTPERFGALRTFERPRLFGLRVERDSSAAREAAPELAGQLRGLDFNRARAVKAGDVARAQDAVRTARSRLSALQPIRGTHASRIMEMQRLLTQAGKALQIAERAGLALASKLTPMLPAGEAVGLIRTAASLGRDLAMGVDPDRQQQRGRGMGLGR